MPLNAVERRLVDLRHEWDAFASNPVPSLLVWSVPDAAMRLVQCFLEIQKHEGPYVTGDLFIRFDEPFENSIQYSRALKQSLAGQLEASRSSLTMQGLAAFSPADMSCPDSAWGFIRTMLAVGGTYHQAIGHLVAVLAPPAAAPGFAGWLSRALDAGLPERLRLLALDSQETPLLGDLHPAQPAVVLRQALSVNTTAMATETFAQERAAGPAGVFRTMLMALVALAERGTAAQVQENAQGALAFSRTQGWHDQGAVVFTLVAGALLKEQRFDAAAGAYRSARAAAAQAQAGGNPAGGALVLQSWFGEAGVHLAAGRLAEAAAAYDAAAALAAALPDLVLGIEAFRMSAFCRARNGDAVGAAASGRQALTLGARLRPAVRGMTTLPLAATGLLAVLDPVRTSAIAAVGARRMQQAGTLHADLERHAALHERTPTNDVLHAAERALETRLREADAAAEAEVQEIVAGAAEPFRRVAAEARLLLGPSWPLAGRLPGGSAAA